MAARAGHSGLDVIANDYSREEKNTMKTIAAAVVSLALVAPALAQDAPAAGSPEFNAAVRDYLLSNPEILEEMSKALEAKRQGELRERQVAALDGERERLFQSADDLVLGNPDGDVTIVEFFDYNCGVCRSALADMKVILERDPDVRFVLKEWPILGPASMEAHLVSRAVGLLAPDKYAEFHVALMERNGRANGDAAMSVARSLDIDTNEVERLLEAPETMAPLQTNYELASALGINGTPSYVLPGEVFFGAVGADALLERIAAERDAATQ